MSIEKTFKLEPGFQFGDINQSVFLSEGPVSINVDGNTYTGHAEARLDLLPSAHIRIYTNFDGIPAPVPLACTIGQKEINLLKFKEKEIPGFLLGLGGDANSQTWNFPWAPKSEPIVGIGDDSTVMQRLVFHLFNFKDLIGTNRSREQSVTATHSIDQVKLKADSWSVELRS